MTPAPLLNVRGLTLSAGPDRAGAATIVDNVSFSLEPGKVIGLIGESGAGKSTLGLASIGHLRSGIHHVSGSVELQGQDLYALSPRALLKLKGDTVSYVAQSAAAAFSPNHRLIDQVIEAAVWHGTLTRQQALARAKELFALLTLPDPENFGNKYPHQASGGQLQRAMTAMALCSNPALVVFDEPTTALDVTTQIDVLLAIKNAIRITRTAAVYITHDLAVVAQIADNIMVLRHGKTVEYGSTEDIIERPRQDYTRALVSVRRHRHDASDTSASKRLEISGIAASYGKMPVLHDVSVFVEEGRTLAIVGESGSGKSTLARVAMGLMEPTKGHIVLDGRRLPASVTKRNRDDLRRVQIINQIPDVALNPRHTIERIISRPLKLYFGMRAAERRARVRDLLAEIELPESIAHRFPAELSGGQKQRVCIARALAAQPDVIVCDEPTSALDPLVADGVLKLLRKLQVERGVSYLFITHDLETVEAIADSIAVMREGRLIRFGSKQAVLSPPFDSYTAQLLESVPKMQRGWLETVRPSPALGAVPA
ncbi:peptide/nickel transport system ATP-binding protein [Aureimonas altamirensis DSM 21988]|uniref:Peptide/nickel transport system ATP-binding protein n=1 Tax=Aureimonas altamirensis DSM 21988 TaxID=1121026 RepID=A0ABY1IND3_9HYPH|nr:ABC transporter ATP-binding protein [Aureimonas altamirensis]SHJ56860.1 peptide/nickel transport system ATP-binding protein [Aureimonas altamirensis DSM 21988]